MNISENDLPPLSKEAQELKIGRYKHYKGLIHKVLGVGRHSETLAEFVVYEHGGEIWVRPLRMFIENVEAEGRSVPRFKFLK